MRGCCLREEVGGGGEEGRCGVGGGHPGSHGGRGRGERGGRIRGVSEGVKEVGVITGGERSSSCHGFNRGPWRLAGGGGNGVMS